MRISTSKPEAVSDRHCTCLLSQWRMEHESKDVDLLVDLDFQPHLWSGAVGAD